MNSIKTYLTVWISGMIAGIVLIERWRRMGGSSLSATANTAEPIGTSGATTTVHVSTDNAKTSTLIVTGAKSDIERARQLLKKVAPW